MTLNVFSISLTPLISLVLLCSISCIGQSAYAQHTFAIQNQGDFLPNNFSSYQDSNDTANVTVYPKPKKVLKQSLFIPGWGQITNKQAWKIPIIYGTLGGLTYYSIHLHKNYNDYRAAYYNAERGADSDFKFGPTPSNIPENASLEALRQNRNFYRNRRDLVYVFIGLSYALNVIDAYVFAHLRSFDVSDDLSMKPSVQPSITSTRFTDPVPSVSLSIHF